MSELTFRWIAKQLDDPELWNFLVFFIWYWCVILSIGVFRWEIGWFMFWLIMFCCGEAKLEDLWKTEEDRK